MQGIYLPRQLACKIIELEVAMQEAEGLSRESILDLIDCYTVTRNLLRMQSSFTTKKAMTAGTSITSERCRISYNSPP
jgi:hypothetical protein